MSHITHAQCLICGKTFEGESFEYVCPDHGNEGILDIQYDYNRIRESLSPEQLASNPDPSIWRYRPLLPVNSDSKVPALSIGGTPLYHFETLARDLGIRSFHLKDDGRLPTASFKDRASAIAAVKSVEKGAKIITTASTGNAAAALSGICASMGLPNIIFVPHSAPQAKIAQLLMFGSKVILVEGTYDDAFDLCLDAAAEHGWYNRNTGFNPYMSEGKKTCAFEICEQLDWQAPDVIAVSVGDGCIIGGIHKGLRELYHLGWIDTMPRLIGVQAQGSSYMADAWKNNENVIEKTAQAADTVADSISAGLPRDRIKALNAVTQTQGAYVTVSDDEILRAIPDLASRTGVFAEPAGAATWAGIQKAAKENLISVKESVVMINTGSGLKDVNSAMKAVELEQLPCFRIPPDITEVNRMILLQ